MTAPGPQDSSALDDAVAELERTAERLRDGELAPAEAAELVERCAELAARAGNELERTARAAAHEPSSTGQETLL